MIRSIGTLTVAFVLVAALEGLAILLSLKSEAGSWSALLAPPAAELQETVSALVGGALGIGATLLGLYYATVGVIASTIYRSVPGDVRDLFIAERSGEAYLKIVILAITTSIVVLVAGILGWAVAGLTLFGVGLLAAFAAVGLVVLTKRLFDYFDPSKLSPQLLADVARGIRDATDPRTRALSHRQTEAHYRVYGALASFRHLVDLLDHPDFRNATASMALTRQLLDMLSHYSSWKYTIPTDSNWWERVPTYRNWLTIDHSRLELALNTSVAYPPELQPDYMWFENSVVQLLKQSLAVGFQSQGGANALGLMESVADLVADLTARLQIDEAVAVEAAWDGVIREVAMTPRVADIDAADHQVRVNQMAAAQSLVLPLTKMVLGLEYAARSIVRRDLSAEVDLALSDPDALYRGNLPTTTRKMLESFSVAIARETVIEGRRVTPQWWVNHFAARSMAEALLATEAGVLLEVERRTTGQVTQFVEAGRHDLAAVSGMASLELLSKIEAHQPTIRTAQQRLETHRNSNASVPAWPVRTPSEVDPADAHTAMLVKLSGLLPELRRSRFEPHEPDLYGQLYQFVVDGAFRAILAGDNVRGLAMYRAAVLEMDIARTRVMSDLQSQELSARLVYALEPIITAMDLAGYALLMFELDGDGIWPEVKQMWDLLLTENPQVADRLLTAASYIDNIFAMTVGGLERSKRTIALERLLIERQIGSEQGAWDGSRWRPHASPIVSALAHEGYGVRDDLYALFIADYLVRFLPEEASLGHKADMIANQIALFRRATDPGDATDSESESSGNE